MSKTISTGTKITFKETGEKFILTQTETGFDARQIKFSKNVQPEHWAFSEFLTEYENGNILIDGFEEGDAGLVHSIITNYVYQTNLKVQLEANEQLKVENSKLTTENTELTTKVSELENTIAEKDKEIKTLETTIGAMKDEEEEEETINE